MDRSEFLSERLPRPPTQGTHSQELTWSSQLKAGPFYERRINLWGQTWALISAQLFAFPLLPPHPMTFSSSESTFTNVPISGSALMKSVLIQTCWDRGTQSVLSITREILQVNFVPSTNSKGWKMGVREKMVIDYDFSSGHELRILPWAHGRLYSQRGVCFIIAFCWF